MAVCLAVQKWKYYLLGRHFIVRTDQQSLRHITQQNEVGNDYQKWVSKLLGYSFEVQFKHGRSNLVADALSHKSVGEIMLGALLVTTGWDWLELDRAVNAEPVLRRIIDDIGQGKTQLEGFAVVDGRLMCRGRVVIPRTYKLKEVLLREYHCSTTYLRLAVEWQWAGMRKDVTTFVQECAICQQNKNSQRRPAGLLQPLPIPSAVWEDISLDFIEGLPLSRGVDTILVIVDRLTKYGHFVGLRHPFTAVTIAEVFVKEVVRLHGFHSSIISDRDRIFPSQFWRELFKL